MWNKEILLQYVRDSLCTKGETAFHREPILFIIDSYDCHVKLAESKELERYNIYVILVPKNLTNILQPLDVAVNRSFQAYYQTLFDSYIGRAIDDPAMQTKAGNPKVPSYKMVSEWVIEWMNSKQPNEIANAFRVCGLVPQSEFQLEILHSPLKALFQASFDINHWKEMYMKEFGNTIDRDEEVYDSPNWYLPESQTTSFYSCFTRKKYGNENEWNTFKTELIGFMKQLVDIQDITDPPYFENLEQNFTPYPRRKTGT
jgi:hypothetical protein